MQDGYRRGKASPKIDVALLHTSFQACTLAARIQQPLRRVTIPDVVNLGGVGAGEIRDDLVPILIECTPVRLIASLTSKTLRRWLPGLIECLKVKHIKVPVESCTDALLEEGLCILGACNSSRGVCIVMVIRATYTRISCDLCDLCPRVLPSVGHPVSPVQSSMESVDPATSWMWPYACDKSSK